MSELSIRPMRPGEESAALRLWSLAFRGGDPLPDDRLAPKAGREVFVAESDATLVGVYELYTTEFYCRGRRLPAAGIKAVAVSPECRQTGVGTALMRHSLSAMRERNLLLGVLHPVRESYYRRFGFESAGCRMLLTCPLPFMPQSAPELPMRMLTLDDWPAVADVYHAFAARYSSMHARTGFEWSRVHWLSEPTPPQVVAVGDPAEAFSVLRLKKGLRPAQEACEFAWSTPRGYRSLLCALARIGFNGPTLTWPEPADSPFLALHYDHGIEMHLQSPPMYRVNEVPAALLALPAEGEGEFSLEIEDELAPENRGPWRVRFGEGGVRLSPTQAFHLRMHVRHLAQALLGQPSLAELAACGAVEVRDPAALEAATRLLPRFPTYCTDFF